MSEKAIQNEVRNALAGKAHIFRANVGRAWTGDAKRLPNGDVLIKNPRPFTTGLPVGFPDLFGWRQYRCTAADVGRDLAVFTALEMKSAKGKASTAQSNFIAAVQRSGGRAGTARSVADALGIVGV